MALYAADGGINVTVVDGTAITGLYAADGSWNVVLSLNTIPVGVHHPCGGYWVTVTDSNSRGIYHADGSLFVNESPYTHKAGIRVTAVSGDLTPTPGAGPSADFSDELNSMYIFILEDF